MSKYTTELRYICESIAEKNESVGMDGVEEVIEAARESIFSFDYPMFDADYREEFEKKFLLHFYTREIGYETYGLWKLKLWDKLNMIMPYYNQLYASERDNAISDPYKDVDIEIVEHDKKSGSSSTSGTTSKSDTGTVGDQRTEDKRMSDTPQGNLTDVEGDTTYLSRIERNSGGNTRTLNTNTSGSTSGSGTSSNEDWFTRTLKGKQGTQSYAKLLSEFRNTFLNIDKMVMDELESLFIGLW